MDHWQLEFLERCADGAGAALGEGAFASGPALWVGKREVAHFDRARTLDVRLTREVIRRRRDELKRDPRVTLRKATSDWVEVEVATDADVAWAQTLVRDSVAANLPSARPGPVGPATVVGVSSPQLPGGAVHDLPRDLRDALVDSATALAAWKDITPLARNEFICWVEDAKQPTTRERRIRRTREELEDGQRRPCCWPGCKHRERTGR